jgi:SAM-dependent methyltransferase
MTDKPNADMAAFWSGEGGDKWVNHEDRFTTSLEIFGRQAMATISSDECILDIGFGCGDTTVDLARCVGAGGHVHGVDISTTLVETARKKISTYGLDNVTFECADAQIAEFPSGEYDAVFSRFGVMFFDDPVAAFKNIYNALKPSGRIGFMCWGPRPDNDWVELPLQVVAKHVSLPPPPKPGTPGPFSLSKKGHVEGILALAGFRDVKVKPFSAPFVMGANADEAVNFLMELSPSGGALNNADADARTRALVAAEMADLLNSYQGEQGISMNATALLVPARRD